MPKEAVKKVTRPTESGAKVPMIGDHVKDRVTGFEGIATARTKYINMCDRFLVQGQQLKDGVPTDPQSFDTTDLTVIRRNAVALENYEELNGLENDPKKSGKTGGPGRHASLPKGPAHPR